MAADDQAALPAEAAMHHGIRAALAAQAHDLPHHVPVQGQAAQDEGRAVVVRLRMRLHRERAVMEDEGDAASRAARRWAGRRDSGGR